jgi:hypothetical protein
MRRDEQTHDAVVIEIVYILIACGVPLVGVLLSEAIVGRLFGLHSSLWVHVAEVVSVVAILVAMSRAVWLNHELQRRIPE